MQAEGRGEDECEAEHGPCVGDLPEEQKHIHRQTSLLGDDDEDEDFDDEEDEDEEPEDDDEDGKEIYDGSDPI